MKCWCGGEVGAPLIGRTYCVDSEFHDPLATGRPERITTLYVAGPMSGIPECNYPAFNEAAEQLSGAGFAAVNPAASVTGTEAHYVDFIREDLRMMLDCDGVAVLENWWESTGARNEVQVAGLLKMPVRSITEWLSRAAYELHKGA